MHQLGEEICSGVYRPGDVLPSEHVLGERLGVSRIIVREPMYWSLFDADVIAWRARTATHDEALAKELMELRRIVEPAACRFAAARISADERQRRRRRTQRAEHHRAGRIRSARTFSVRRASRRRRGPIHRLTEIHP